MYLYKDKHDGVRVNPIELKTGNWDFFWGEFNSYLHNKILSEQ